MSAIAALLFVVWVGPLVRDFFVPEAEVNDFFDVRLLLITTATALVAAFVSSLIRMPRSVHAILAVAQVALAFVLLAGAGLFWRSLQEVRRLDWGYNADGVVLMTANLTGAAYPTQEANAIFQRLLERAQSLSDVESAALDVSLPFGGGMAGGLVPMDSDGNSRGVVPFVHIVTPDYMNVLGTKLLQGRNMTAADAADTPPVLLVSRRTTLEYWSGQDPLSKCFLAFTTGQCFQVTGVLENTRWRVQGGAAPPEVFIPLAQARSAFPSAAIRYLLVRTRGGRNAGDRIAEELRNAEPDLPYVNAVPLWSLLNTQTRTWRLGVTGSGFFAVSALLLASIAVFGLASFSVLQRSLMVVTGWLLGVGASIALAPYIRNLLFNIEPMDLWTFATASGLMIVVILAALLPSGYTAMSSGRSLTNS